MKMDGLMGSMMRFQFTDFAMRPGKADSPVLQIPANAVASGELSFRDCQLRGCKLSVAPGSTSVLTVALNNNLVEYCDVDLIRASGASLTALVYNNLFRDCNHFSVAYTESGSNPTWYIRDNLFNGTPQTLSNPGTTV